MHKTVIVSLLLVLVMMPLRAQDNMGEPQNPLIYLLTYGEALLGTDWYIFYAYDAESMKTFGWTDNESSSDSIVMSYLIFESPEKIDGYFNEPYFDVTLQSYLPVSHRAQCTEHDVTLTEFDSVRPNNPFTIRHYYWHVTDRELVVVMLIFRAEEINRLDEYAKLIQPELISCRQVNE